MLQSVFLLLSQAPTPDKHTKFSEFSEVIVKHGDNWDWEPHEVTTKDGYILNMFRMTADKYGQSLNSTKGPILL